MKDDLFPGAIFKTAKKQQMHTKKPVVKSEERILALVCEQNTSFRDFEHDFRFETDYILQASKKKNRDIRAVRYSGDYKTAKFSNELHSQDNNHREKKYDLQNSEITGFLNDTIDNDWKLLLATCSDRHNHTYKSITIYRDKATKTDYSFIIRTTINMRSSIHQFPGFYQWLKCNEPRYLSEDCYEEEDFIFQWLLKNISEHQNKVFDGLWIGLSDIFKRFKNSDLSIIISDGSGFYVYLHQPEREAEERGFYYRTISEKNFYMHEMKLASEDMQENGWKKCFNDCIYYFPVQGGIVQYFLKKPQVESAGEFRKSIFGIANFGLRYC